MRFRPDIAVKTVLEADVGEWLRFDGPDGPVLAWVTAEMRPQGRELVIFDLTGAKPPRYTQWTYNVLALSFGRDGIIEPLDPTGSFAAARDYRNLPGTMAISTTGTFLCAIDTRGPWKDPIEINVETGAIREDFQGQNILFNKWRLWANEAERQTVGREPLLDYEAKIVAQPE